MAISNTRILIKRSTVTATPSGLNAGELAYSYLSNTLFLGNTTGTGVVNVGGLFYTQAIDNATSANTPSTIIKRDTNSNVAVNYVIGNVTGSANAATYLTNPQNFSISGGDVTASAQSFNGNQAVTLNASLTTVSGLTAGTYGNTTSIPIIQVAANGRVMSISNSATVSTSFTVTGNTGSGSQAGGGTLTIVGGGTGITTTVTGSGGSETVTLNHDNTVARTNTSAVGTQVFNTDINLPSNSISAVNGTFTNITVSGNVYQFNANSTLNVTDPMIYLAANNSGNAVDIGMVGHFIGTGHTGGPSIYQHTGFVRDYSDNKWKLFSNVSIEPTTTVTFDANTFYDTIKVGGIDLTSGTISAVGVANITSATIGTLFLTNPLAIGQGGTNATSYAQNGTLVYNGTSFATIANVTSYTTQGSSSYVPVISTDSYGRVTAITNTQIAIDASQITSNVLTYARGGTGSSSYTTGQVLVAGATGFTQLANVTAVSATVTSSNTVASLTTDVYGRVTAFSQQAISGLTVAQGGTGASSFTSGQMLVYNGTSLASRSNVTQTVTGALSTSNTITAIAFDPITGGVTSYTGAAISGLTVAQGGTGSASFTTGNTLFFNGTSLASRANVTQTVTGGLSAANTITSISFDPVTGGVTAYTGSAISGLTVAQGGTGASAFTAGQMIVYNGTSQTSRANVTQAVTGGLSAANTITSIAFDPITGGVTSYTGSAISGLTVAQGGTGTSSFNTGQLVFYNGTSQASRANVTQTVTGALSTANTITAIAFDPLTGGVTSYTGAAISGLTVPQGGTGQSAFNAGQLVVGNGTGALQQIANVTTTVTGGLSTSNTITSITTDAWGRLTAYTGSAISGLTVAQGGTGASSFTAGQMLVYNGTSQASRANVTQTVTGGLSTANTITSLSFDPITGGVTAYTGAAISGLTVGQGGTGASTFQANGVVYGNGTGALQATALAGAADQTWTNQILTVTNTGTPVWATNMDGGTF